MIRFIATLALFVSFQIYQEIRSLVRFIMIMKRSSRQILN